MLDKATKGLGWSNVLDFMIIKLLHGEKSGTDRVPVICTRLGLVKGSWVRDQVQAVSPHIKPPRPAHPPHPP